MLRPVGFWKVFFGLVQPIRKTWTSIGRHCRRPPAWEDPTYFWIWDIYPWKKLTFVSCLQCCWSPICFWDGGIKVEKGEDNPEERGWSLGGRHWSTPPASDPLTRFMPLGSSKDQTRLKSIHVLQKAEVFFFPITYALHQINSIKSTGVFSDLSSSDIPRLPPPMLPLSDLEN